MRAARRAAAAAALWSSVICSPASGQPAMADFARGAQIQLSGRGPVVRLVLPESVYTTVTRADLADVRVFNRAGDTVPHSLRHAPAPQAAVTTLVGVPFFPLRRETPEETVLTQVAVGPGGAIVEVRGGTPPSEDTVGYLLDTTSVKVPVDRLSLEWDAPPGTTFLARVSVDASDDLTLWRSVAMGTAIARLQYGDRQLTQADIDLSGAALSTAASATFDSRGRRSWPRFASRARACGPAALRPRPRSRGPHARGAAAARRALPNTTPEGACRSNTWTSTSPTTPTWRRWSSAPALARKPSGSTSTTARSSPPCAKARASTTHRRTSA